MDQIVGRVETGMEVADAVAAAVDLHPNRSIAVPRACFRRRPRPSDYPFTGEGIHGIHRGCEKNGQHQHPASKTDHRLASWCAGPPRGGLCPRRVAPAEQHRVALARP